MLGVGHTPPLNEPTVSSLSPALLCLSPLSRQTSVSGPQPPEERTPLLRLFFPAEMLSPAKLTSSMAHTRGTFSRKPVPLSPGGPGHPPPSSQYHWLVLSLGCRSHCHLTDLTHPCLFQVELLLLLSLSGARGSAFHLGPPGQT